MPLMLRGPLLIALVGIACLALPALAFAHLERASYWPDPRLTRP